MKELSLHIMDIIQNSITAGSSQVIVKIVVYDEGKYLSIIVVDNGRGMDEEALKSSQDPFHTSRRTRKIGLGIPMFKEAAELTGGSFEIESSVGEGTTVKAVFLNGSIDRQPLGDLGNVFFLNMISYGDVEFCLELSGAERKFAFSSQNYMNGQNDSDMSAMDAAFEAENLINKKVREMFEGVLPELGGDLSGIK